MIEEIQTDRGPAMIETLINDLGTQTGHMNNVCRLSSHKGSIEVIHILVYQGEEKSKRADSMHCVSTFCMKHMVLVA